MNTVWVDEAEDSGFGVSNLPYGVFSKGKDGDRHVGVRLGDYIVDVTTLSAARGTQDRDSLRGPTLNAFMARGKESWQRVREWLTECLTDTGQRRDMEGHLVACDAAVLHLPFDVADYVDFYSSEHHAANVGRMFRPDAQPLLPNWKHMPIAYHGRSGTVVVSDTPIVRPSGQRKAPTEENPTFGPSQRLDIEAEVGFVVGVPSQLGVPVAVDEFESHVFGVCLVNDWSARDIQAWEYVPLGPFLGKSFATSVSPWIVTLDALEAARVAAPQRDVEPLPYLRDGGAWGLDLSLDVRWNDTPVSRPPFSTMYWTAPQQLAHMTVNGASVRTGDLFASGTVSGPQKDQRGSFLELSWGGQDPIVLGDGSERFFLEDGDVVRIGATAPGRDGSTIDFGEVSGAILPARNR